MKVARHILLWCSCFLVWRSVFAQDTTSRWTFRGYLKDLAVVSQDVFRKDVSGDFILHNRMNFRYAGQKHWVAGFEFRNRIFLGDTPLHDSLFKENLLAGNRLSIAAHSGMVAAHFAADRAWIGYSAKRWMFSAGRQRINWGVTEVWNTNDLFNTFSYADFDYEERPGRESVRLQIFPSALSRIEISAAPAFNGQPAIAAALYRFHVLKSDAQILGGIRGDFTTLGAGFETGAGRFTFKGESTLFRRNTGLGTTSNGSFVNVSLSCGFTAGRNWYFLFSGLYQSAQNNTLDPAFLTGILSPQSLSPFRFTAFQYADVRITPLISASAALFENPEDGTLFMMPSLTCNVEQNLDLMLLSQMLCGNTGSGYELLSQTHFLRLKWSF